MIFFFSYSMEDYRRNKNKYTVKVRIPGAKNDESQGKGETHKILIGMLDCINNATFTRSTLS
jgi:hypothetical protein